MSVFRTLDPRTASLSPGLSLHAWHTFRPDTGGFGSLDYSASKLAKTIRGRRSKTYSNVSLLRKISTCLPSRVALLLTARTDCFLSWNTETKDGGPALGEGTPQQMCGRFTEAPGE